MASVTAGLENLRNLGRMYQGVLSLIPQLEEIESLENNVAELREQLETLSNEKDFLLADMKRVKDMTKAEMDKADEYVQRANGQYTVIMSQAEDEVIKIKKEMNDELAKMRADANLEMDKIMTFVQGKERESNELIAVIAEQTEHLSNLQAKLEEIRSMF